MKIIDKRGRLVSLEPNEGQLMLHKSMAYQRGMGFPVRIVLLKPRQIGWSTWCEAEGFSYINLVPNRTALAVSADDDSTRFIFRMTQLYQDELPLSVRRKAESSTQYAIIYSAPHRSRFLTQTAGKMVLGRGGTIHYLHCSELAFWPNDKEGLAAVTQMIPEDVETTVILESTAFGEGGSFYDMYWQAKDRVKAGDYSGYIPVFYPWYKFDEYKIKPPRGFVLTDEERVLKKKYGLEDSQVFYRRQKIQSFGGDDKLFRREYPASDEEAFLATGTPVFSETTLRQEVLAADNCMFIMDGEKIKVEMVNRSFNCWKVVKYPVRGHEYAVGLDSMESRLSDPNDPESGSDRDAISVFDRDSNEIAAIYTGQTIQDDLAEQALAGCIFYNYAWFAPEIPHAMEVLKVFKNYGYPNIYSRQEHDDQIVVEDGESLGWKTTLITRKWLTDSFLTALRDGLKVNVKDLLDEMKTFVYNKIGTPIHKTGRHDDIIFATMIALQVHLRTPYRMTTKMSEYTGARDDRKYKRDLSMSGAIDDDFDEEEFEDRTE